MAHPKIISPKRRTPRLNQLLELIGSPHAPMQVPVVLDGTAGDDQMFQCYLVVRDRVVRDGGTMVCGWLVALTDIVYQAQHHAVWCPPDEPDSLVCITPKVIVQHEIMFVRDDRYPYRDRDIPNYRVSEPISSVVDDLIIVQRIKEVLEAQFDYKSDREQVIPAKYMKAYQALGHMEREWIQFITLGGRLTSPCFCNSNRLYRDCHGLDMRGKAASLLGDYHLTLEWMPPEG